jgi:hypothetical protein
MTTIADRIERELGIPGLASMLAERLDPSDLQSLLLDVYRRVAERRQTAALLADHAANRFVRPSKIPPAAYNEWERVALGALPPGFEALDLSPVCPLGASAAMAGLAQDWVLSTIRTTEVVSDSTNVLALEAATRRRALRRADPRSAEPVHLAAIHRLLRTRAYDDPRLASHFKVFSLCSAGRDRGGFDFETEALGLQIGCYLRAIRGYLGQTVPLRVLITPISSGEKPLAAAEALVARVRAEAEDVEATLYAERTAGRNYYRSLSFWIHVPNDSGEPIHLVDGGCVDWTQRLLSDGKERLVISGVGSDRVCAMRLAASASG